MGFVRAVLGLVLAVAGATVVVPPAFAGTVHAAVDLVTSPAPGTLLVRGWAFDDGAPSAQLRVHVYVGGPAGSGAPGYDIGPADQYRPDVHAVYGTGEYHGIDRTLAVSPHGPQTVYVYYLGTTMTAELVGSATIADVPPETTITARPPERGTATAVTFGFTASEPSTFRCRFDQAAWAPCTSPASTTVAVGAHTFAVMATNSAGTPDPSPASYAFTVEAPPVAPPVTPPVVTPPPPPPPTIGLRVRAVTRKSRLLVDIDPDLDQSNYRFTIQRRSGKKWRTVRFTQTLGPRDRAVVDLPRGTYRVVVPSQHDMLGARASTRLKR